MANPLNDIGLQESNSTDPSLAVLISEVSDEALEAAVGDFREVKCSDCGGTCNSSCTYSTR